MEVRVPEEPGIICRNLITNDKAIETPIIKQNFPTEPHATPISSCTIPSAMKSNRPKLKSTNIRSVRFSIAEVQASGQPIDSSHNMSLKTTQRYSASTVSRKKTRFRLDMASDITCPRLRPVRMYRACSYQSLSVSYYLVQCFNCRSLLASLYAFVFFRVHYRPGSLFFWRDIVPFIRPLTL